jgi:hypothetical protein
MSTRAAINGFGGSGRTVLRSAIEREAEPTWSPSATLSTPTPTPLRTSLGSTPFPLRALRSLVHRNGAIFVAGWRMEVLTESDPRALLDAVRNRAQATLIRI